MFASIKTIFPVFSKILLRVQILPSEFQVLKKCTCQIARRKFRWQLRGTWSVTGFPDKAKLSSVEYFSVTDRYKYSSVFKLAFSVPAKILNVKS